ncbi:MAG: two-component system OmpR family sensor kinase [Alphaproteobacteria bacterium]
MGLRTITFSLIFAVIISSVSVGWLIDVSYSHFFAKATPDIYKKVSLLKLTGRALADSLENEGNKANAIEQWDLNNEILVKLISLDDIALPISLLAEFKAGEALLLENENGPSFSYFIASSEQVLQISAPIFFAQENESGQLIMTVLFYVVLSLLVTLWVYPLTKRLYSIQQASAAFGKGELHTRLHVGSIAGIRDVELAFNGMASRIQTLLNDVKLLSGGVSHDLKTSLARLRFGIDTIQEEPSSLSNDRLERLSEDTDEMIHLVDKMLRYTQLDMNLSLLEKTAIVFDELLTDVFDKKFTRGQVKGVRLGIRLSNRAYTVIGNTLYLKMMLNNLISNAINHAQTRVEITLSGSDSELCLSIHDDGLGIPKQYHEDVFKPFFRVPGQAKQSKESHYGLGLAISQRIIELHNGYITLSSNTLTDYSCKQDDIIGAEKVGKEKQATMGLCRIGTELLVTLPLE